MVNASKYGGSEKFRAWLQAEREAASDLLLSRFPWQEYPYKRGKWRRDEQIFLLWSEWAQTRQSLLLLDPATGQPLGELWDLEDPSDLGEHGTSGRIQVAGDPRAVALISLTGKVEQAHLAVHRRHVSGNVLELVQRLLAGQLPVEPVDEPGRYGGSLWLADRPEKPTRADGYHWRPWNVDDPILYNRGDGSIWFRYRRETKGQPD